MTRVETLERKIADLSSPELAEFRDWFIQFDAEQWDREIEEDVANGKLDGLAETALRSFRAGNCNDL